LIGIDSNEAGITKGMIGTNYRQEIRKWHPDKLEAICRSKTQQLTNAKAYLDGVYRWYRVAGKTATAPPKSQKLPARPQVFIGKRQELL
jgi:hypothetical protein